MVYIKHYAGIGSRKTPDKVLGIMRQLGSKLAIDGYCLRSGGADGADTAFEKGAISVEGSKEIYLPSKRFNKRNGSNDYIVLDNMYNKDEAMEIAKNYHPKFDSLSYFVKCLMTRNVYQILGKNLDTPSKFVVCWTPDGCSNKKERSIKTGGTGQAIAIASDYNVPVFNLHKKDHLTKIEKYLK